MPFTLEVLRARKRALIPCPFVVFTFGLVVKSIQEFGGVSLEDKLLKSCVLFSTCCVCNFLLVSLNNQSPSCVFSMYEFIERPSFLCLFQCVDSTKKMLPKSYVLCHFQCFSSNQGKFIKCSSEICGFCKYIQ